MLGAHVHDCGCLRAIKLITVKALKLFLDFDGHPPVLPLLQLTAALVMWISSAGATSVGHVTRVRSAAL